MNQSSDNENENYEVLLTSNMCNYKISIICRDSFSFSTFFANYVKHVKN